MRHSTAHVLAQALRHLYGPGVQYTIGPVIENGFFYDFEFPKGVTFSAEDLPKVEAEMQKIVAQDLKFGREDVDPGKAKEILHDRDFRGPRASNHHDAQHRTGNFVSPHFLQLASFRSFTWLTGAL